MDSDKYCISRRWLSPSRMVNVQLTLGSNASIFSFFAIRDFSSIHELS
jgi:hypothetical protein